MKRYLTLTLVKYAAICLVALLILGCSAGDSDEKFKKVDLKIVYSTNGQKELREVLASDGKDIGELMAQTGPGASNVLLVRGKDIQEAIKETRRVVLGGMPGDTASLGTQSPGKLWIVVYWGVAGSDPPNWVISSVERSAKTVRVNYRKAAGGTTDIHPYYAWIPLEDLKPGKLELQLSNQAGECVLTRLCTVLDK